ncbi:MAG: hypothetical protein GWN87_15650 [Desulfuromonadales bacterium]|nr:hypothetical protein [Desulfuromonadales bacterium]
MSEEEDVFSDPPESVPVEVTIPAPVYAELAAAVASDDDPPRALIDVGDFISLIVQEVWKDAGEDTPWLTRVLAEINE